MKLIRPTANAETGKYTPTHKGYDFAGLNLPDEVRAGADGVVIASVNSFNSSWRNMGTLTTRDYGNYIIIKHTDGSSELHAHLKKDSMMPVGKSVKSGEIVARIGNTGNSSGPHLHSEYRDSSGRNMPVEFINYTPKPPMSDIQVRKLVQFDRTVNELHKAGYIPTADSEQFFSNPADEDKFTNLIKRVIRDAKANATPVDVEAIKELGRKEEREKIKGRIKALIDTL